MKPKLKNKNTETTDFVNVFDDCVLISLTTKCWTASKRVNPEKMKSLVKNKDLSKWIKTNKGLIDKEHLAEIQSLINRARNKVKAIALPFPLESIYLCPKILISELLEELDRTIDELGSEVSSFEEKYKEYIEQAREELGLVFFNENDYPTNIKERFGIAYKIVQIGIPEALKQISEKQYKEETEKFKQMMEDARHECVLFLREGFAKTIDAMITSLSGKDGEPKKIRQDSVERIDRFFKEFQSKDIFKDKDLEELIKKGRDIMTGIDAKDLKNSVKLREHILDEMDELGEELQKSITTYKRKITL